MILLTLLIISLLFGGVLQAVIRSRSTSPVVLAVAKWAWRRVFVVYVAVGVVFAVSGVLVLLQILCQKK